MSMYGTANSSPHGNGMQDSHEPKAAQACISCRKQKRKCSKQLPACALCQRMNRHCDYSDASPPPTSDQFYALQQKVMELESTLSRQFTGINPIPNTPTPFGTASSGTIPAPHLLGQQAQAYSPTQDSQWQGVQNRFPAIAFLDKDTFKYGGFAIPKPSVGIPMDALELLGAGPVIVATISEYLATVHRWMPIVSQKRLNRNLENPLYDAGPDLALLFLCMKLIISRPQDGIDTSQIPIYASAKRFLALMEATGSMSLLVLQAGILITWYEYGQSIYPAAYMSAGWCVRYGNLLGINEHVEAAELLGRPSSWTEHEERRRTWWGVLVTDKIVSLGSLGYILTTQEPKNGHALPVDDSIWDSREVTNAGQKLVDSPTSEPAAPFPRLCQAAVLLGKICNHNYGEKLEPEAARFTRASELYSEVSALTGIISTEMAKSTDYLSLTAPLALTYSALCVLCGKYSFQSHSPLKSNHNTTKSPEELAMQVKAVNGLKEVSGYIVRFAENISAATSTPHDLDRVNPIIMDSIYAAASHCAWMVRESGDESSQIALGTFRHVLGKLGSRWRNAAEYQRILEGREFMAAVEGAGSSV